MSIDFFDHQAPRRRRGQTGGRAEAEMLSDVKSVLVILCLNAMAVQSFLPNVAVVSKSHKGGPLCTSKRLTFSSSNLKMMSAPPKVDSEVFGKERLLKEEADIVKMESQGMGKKGVTLQDIISLWVTNIVLTYGDKEQYANLQDGAVVSEGVIDDLVGGPLFLPLYKYFLACGGFYKCVLSCRIVFNCALTFSAGCALGQRSSWSPPTRPSFAISSRRTSSPTTRACSPRSSSRSWATA